MTRREHALARPVRGRAGRRAARLHGRASFDRRLGGRRHRRVAGPRPRPGARRDPRRRRGRLVLAALDRVEAELGRRQFAFVPTDEDIHTAIERRVTELAGPAGRQAPHRAAAATTRWPPRSACTPSASSPTSPGACSPCSACCSSRAGEAGDAYLPGYTHMQRAQPVLLAHHLLAHGWALGPRRRPPARRPAPRLDVSPLGAGALAGSSLPLEAEPGEVDARDRRAARDCGPRTRRRDARRRAGPIAGSRGRCRGPDRRSPTCATTSTIAPSSYETFSQIVLLSLATAATSRPSSSASKSVR